MEVNEVLVFFLQHLPQFGVCSAQAAPDRPGGNIQLPGDLVAALTGKVFSRDHLAMWFAQAADRCQQRNRSLVWFGFMAGGRRFVSQRNCLHHLNRLLRQIVSDPIDPSTYAGRFPQTDDLLPSDQKRLLSDLLCIITLSEKAGNVSDQPRAQSLYEDPKRLGIPFDRGASELFVSSVHTWCSASFFASPYYRG